MDYRSELPSLTDVAERMTELLSNVSETQIEDFCHTLQLAGRIFTGGAGRSGLVSQSFAMRLMYEAGFTDRLSQD